MNRTRRIAVNLLEMCIALAIIAVHIRYLCWERGEFAVGGEWFVYIITIVVLLWRFTDEY